MSFLYPQFLWALLAVLVPIIIHLFDFQKPKKLLFTNVRLLQQLQQSTNKGFKVKHLMVLFARMLFIIFLVLAFAQPFIPSTSNSKIEGKQTASIYVDNSLSMQQTKEGQKSLDLALDEALGIAQVFPINTSFQFLDNNFMSKDQYLINKEQLKDRFTESNYSPVIRDLASVIKRQQSALQHLPTQSAKNIFIISDFQKTTVGDLNKIKADANTNINIVPIQNTEAGNIFIDSLWLQNPFIKPKEVNTLIVKIRNTSQTVSPKIALKLMIEGVQVSSNSVVIPAASAEKVDFSFIINEVGFKKCSISFEENPVTFDNIYYFSLQAAPPIQVLTVAETKDNYLAKVYSSESFFKLESNINNGLNYSFLSQSNIIALQEFDLLDESVLLQIKKQVEKGKTLVMFPSSKGNATNQQAFLKLFGVSSSLLSPSNEQIKIANPDVNNPFFDNIFEKYNGNENMPISKPILQLNANALLKYQSGLAFITESKLGKGKVYTCASSLEEDLGNVASHALFVPIMYKLAILSAKEQSALAYTFNDRNISLQLSSNDKQMPVKLVKEGVEIVPSHQWVDGKLNIQIPKLEMKPGFYELKQGNQLLQILAFNYGKQESTLNYYSSDELKKIFANQKNIKIFDVKESGDASASFKNEAIGVNFWKYSLVLSLLFLLIEILLVRWLDLSKWFAKISLKNNKTITV